MVDYLDFMYERQVLMMSRRPRPIVSYDTIIHPFDYQTWLFTFTLIIVEFILLLLMQKLWSQVSGKPGPSDHVFQGLKRSKQSGYNENIEIFFRLLCLNRDYTYIHIKILDSKRGIPNKENLNP